MTEEEAIKWINDRMCYGRYTPQKHRPFVHDECCQAGELAIKALEKQIAKKPIKYNAENSTNDVLACCPICDSNVDWTYKGHWRKGNPPYCKNCGQRLDWEDSEV